VFTPDVVGKYVLTEGTSNATVTVYGGTWEGAIVLMIRCADGKGTVVGKVDQEMRLAMSPAFQRTMDMTRMNRTIPRA
jgi:hypothetical protein